MVRGGARGLKFGMVHLLNNICSSQMLRSTKASEPRSGLLQAEHFRPKSCYLLLQPKTDMLLGNIVEVPQILHKIQGSIRIFISIQSALLQNFSEVELLCTAIKTSTSQRVVQQYTPFFELH